MSYSRKILLSNPRLAIKMMTSLNEKMWIHSGEKTAINTFRDAIKYVPAYKEFIGRDISINNIQDFKNKIPITNKDNYFRENNFKKLIKENSDILVYSTSSGSTGKPIYSPVDRNTFEPFAGGMTAFFDYYWDIVSKKKKTLFINSMALGMWMGGLYGSFVFERICNKYKNLTLTTPGADAEQVIRILKDLGSDYELIIITTYPSLFKSFINLGNKKGINWRKLNVKFVSGGEFIDPHIYQFFCESLSGKKYDPYVVFDAYGGTEIGNPGIATPLSSIINHLCRKNPKLNSLIFSGETGTLFQNNPQACFVESINNDLVITKNGIMPVVRYNVKDIGKIISWSEMKSYLHQFGYTLEQLSKKYNHRKKFFKWQFITISGRRDWALSFFGMKISPEGIQAIINEDKNIFSFKFSPKHFSGSSRGFYIFIEIQPGIKLTNSKKITIKKKYSKKILKYLLETNYDFRDAYHINKKILTPKIEIFSFGEGPFRKERINKIKLLEG